MPPASRLKFDFLSPNTQAFAVVMDAILAAYPAALKLVRGEQFVASRMRLTCYEDMALIRLAPKNPSSRFDAYYVFVGMGGFMHHTTGEGTDMEVINARTTPNLPDAAEECVRLGLLLAHNQDGALIEREDEIFWNGRPASEVPPITPLQIGAPDQNRRITVSAILQIQGHLHRHRYTLWPDGSLQLNEARLLLASPHLAAPPPFMPFAALQDTEQPAPDEQAAGAAGSGNESQDETIPEGHLTGAAIRRLAVREAGRALVALTGPARAYGVPTATIIPRADANLGLGSPSSVEQDSRTRAEMEESIRVTLGGRAAEELVYGVENISGGAGGGMASDLAQATQAILRLLTAFGFSKAGGLLWLDWDAIRNQPMGDDILREARTIADRLYEEALARLESNRATLERVVAVLMERQKLGADELRQLVPAN